MLPRFMEGPLKNIWPISNSSRGKTVLLLSVSQKPSLNHFIISDHKWLLSQRGSLIRATFGTHVHSRLQVDLIYTIHCGRCWKKWSAPCIVPESIWLILPCLIFTRVRKIQYCCPIFFITQFILCKAVKPLTQGLNGCEIIKKQKYY